MRDSSAVENDGRVEGGEDGVEISKAFPFLCLARDDTTRKRIDLSLDSILFSRV